MRAPVPTKGARLRKRGGTAAPSSAPPSSLRSRTLLAKTQRSTAKLRRPSGSHGVPPVSEGIVASALVNALPMVETVLAPSEEQIGSKTGQLDESVLMDWDEAPGIGRALQRMKEAARLGPVAAVYGNLVQSKLSRLLNGAEPCPAPPASLRSALMDKSVVPRRITGKRRL